jgi:hypothetical protein
MNNALTGQYDRGGGIYLNYAVGTVYNTTISFNQAGDGGGVYLQYRSDLNMTNTVISYNNAKRDGGGLRIGGDGGSNVIIRQSSLMYNDATRYGNEIVTWDMDYLVCDDNDCEVYNKTKISLINTYFLNPNDNNNIYEIDEHVWNNNFEKRLGHKRTWKNCSDNLCTEEPFAGTCNAVNDDKWELGVLCNLNCPANHFAPLVSVAMSAPSSSDHRLRCKPWQDINCDAGYKHVNGTATSDANCVQCGPGTMCQGGAGIGCNAGYKRVDGTAIADANCIECGPGQFQPANQFTGTACQGIGYSGIKCNAGYKLVNGNATSDENCVQCSPGQFQRWNQFTGRRCQVQQDIKCNAGHKLVQNAISDAYCLECDEGQFQSANQFIGTSCTNWKQCNKNESISFNGNLISDRTCILKPTKPANVITTAAPSVTTTTNAAITSSKRKKNELSNSTVNTMSIISIVIMFMIVIYNL